MSNLVFSDVSIAYNENVANLNKAKNIFQKEVNDLNRCVIIILNDAPYRSKEDSNWRWGTPNEDGTRDTVSWLNFSSRSSVQLGVKLPRRTNFTNKAAELFFEIMFDTKLEKFVFQARFYNLNNASEKLDEKITKIIEGKDQSVFHEHYYVKNDTCVLFRHDLDCQLADNLHRYVVEALNVCEAAVEEIYPDSEYHDSSLENNTSIL